MSIEKVRQIFSNPASDTSIMSAWENYLSGEPCQSDALRRLIDDSWRRCHTAQVDPGRESAPPPCPRIACIPCWIITSSCCLPGPL